MDLDAVCARCALSPALSLVKYVETGRTAANTATNKPSKRKNELLGATWIADFLQKQNFDVDQPALCSSCLSVLEPEFGRWIQPRGGTKEKQLLCAAGFWSCTSQKGLKEARQPAVSVGRPLANLPRCPTRVYPACCQLAVPRSMPLAPPTGRMDQAQCPLDNG